MASEAGFAEGAEEVAEGFEAEEVKALVGDFELGLLLRVPDLSADAGAFRRVVRLIDGYVIFLLQALDQLLDEIFEFAVHLHLLEAVAHFFVEGFSIEEGLLDGAAEFVKSLLAFGEFVPEIVIESALQEIVRESAEQVLHAHIAGGVGDVFGVADAFHKTSCQLSVVSSQ